MNILFLLFLLVTSVVHSGETKETNQYQGKGITQYPPDTLLGLSTLALLADWSTTRNVSKQWDTCNCYEENSSLGPRPSPEKVDRYFLKRLILHLSLNSYIRFRLEPNTLTSGILWGDNLSILIRHGKAAYDTHTTFGISYRF